MSHVVAAVAAFKLEHGVWPLYEEVVDLLDGDEGSLKEAVLSNEVAAVSHITRRAPYFTIEKEER